MSKEYVVNKVTGERCEVLFRDHGGAHWHLRDALGRPFVAHVDTFSDPVVVPGESAPAPAADVTAGILEDRGKKYGPFTGHAEITQSIKKAMFQRANGADLADDQKEALDMIAHKIGRIINGDPNYVDSWDDIAGYARLVADRLRGVVR